MANIFQAQFCEVCQKPTIAVVKARDSWLSVCQSHAIAAITSKKAGVK